MQEVNTTSLLECVLRLADATAYVDCFKKENLQAKHLGILSDKDLEMIGVDDRVVRGKIIKASSNLLINMEKKTVVDINAEYAATILRNIDMQLKMHTSNLALCAYRLDILNENVDLEDSDKALFSCIGSLRKELQLFKDKIVGNSQEKGGSSSKRRRCMQAILLSAGIVCFTCLLRKYKG
ncbi:PREDICTED: uncharacterized protein LOC108565508 [Nicrophorus vespilloides]|uniref:Uncharacterized protein LOC108565508 n=1 Tax=Nicrophorus vespilloides TaxID=110193 RepID=A0ABM1N103_NICVS|nr:PREDICTED: uncharacterized protein LOC108565508 [Nicrophorus vespilloides]